MVRESGSYLLFRMWMTRFLVDEKVADDQGVAVADTFAVSPGAAAGVMTAVAIVVGFDVGISVGGSVTAAVAAGVVAGTAGFAGWVVHPLAATRSITRINTPRIVFIRYN
jgi:hypothetical protein